ncbi:hypothetical protein Tco_1407712 [Tanacetum coccineum]
MEILPVSSSTPLRVGDCEILYESAMCQLDMLKDVPEYMRIASSKSNTSVLGRPRFELENLSRDSLNLLITVYQGDIVASFQMEEKYEACWSRQQDSPMVAKTDLDYDLTKEVSNELTSGVLLALKNIESNKAVYSYISEGDIGVGVTTFGIRAAGLSRIMLFVFTVHFMFRLLFITIHVTVHGVQALFITVHLQINLCGL